MTDSHASPLLDFDPTPTAIIEPAMWHRPIEGLAPAGLMTWMADAYQRLIDSYPTTVVHRFSAETADIPIHRVELATGPVTAILSHVGAPVSAALYETMIAIGCTTIVAVGSSGGLVPEHRPGTVVVPDAAIRDEGTSHHYLPPARLVHPDTQVQQAVRTSMIAAGISPVAGTIWTTDAIFRETPARVQARVAEGALAVDMEASALAAIAKFRGTRHGHAVYMADTLHGDEWDPTELIERDTDFRYRLLVAAGLASRSGLT